MSQILYGDADRYVAVNDGAIEIAVGNTVYVKSIEEWHRLAVDAEQHENHNLCETKLERIERYFHLLCEVQKVDHRVDKEIDEALQKFREVAGV